MEYSPRMEQSAGGKDGMVEDTEPNCKALEQSAQPRRRELGGAVQDTGNNGEKRLSLA